MSISHCFPNAGVLPWLLIVAMLISAPACSGPSPSPDPDTGSNNGNTNLPLSLVESFDPVGYNDEATSFVEDIEHDVPPALMSGQVKSVDDPTGALVQGYRLQFASTTNRNDAELWRNKLMAWWQSRVPDSTFPASAFDNNFEIEILYEKPNYKVRIGNFVKQAEAERARSYVAVVYREAWVVPQVISRPEYVASRATDGFVIELRNSESPNVAHNALRKFQRWQDRLKQIAQDSLAGPVLFATSMEGFVSYTQPYYRARVGAFTTATSAEQAISLFQNYFPKARVVPALIDQVSTKAVGYRIQLASESDRQVAEKWWQEASAWWSGIKADPGTPTHYFAEDLPLYIVYNAPEYRVRLGDYPSETLAASALAFVQTRFPQAWLVIDSLQANPADAKIEYQVQFFASGEEQEAMRWRQQAYNWWATRRLDPALPQGLFPYRLPVNITFQQPFYTTRIGHYESKKKANLALTYIRERFPNAYVVFGAGE